MYQTIAFVVVGLIFLYFIFLRPYLKRKKEVKKEEKRDISELITEKKKEETGAFIFDFGKRKREEEEKRKNGTMYFVILALENPEHAKKIFSEVNPKCFDFETLFSGKRSALVCEILLEYFSDKLTCDQLIRFEEMTEDLVGVHENNFKMKELAMSARLERFPETFKAKDLFGILGNYRGYYSSIRLNEKMKQLARKILLSFPKENFEFKNLWDYELARSTRTGIKHEVAREIILRYFVNAENMETMFSDWYKKYYDTKREEEMRILDVFFEALLLEAKPDDCEGLLEVLNSCGFYKFNEGILMRFMEKRGKDFDLWTLLNLSSRESTQIFKKKVDELALSLPKEEVKYTAINTHMTSLSPNKELIKKLLEKYFPGIEESKKMTGKEFANKYKLTKCEALV